jgi:hypothetical protein
MKKLIVLPIIWLQLSLYGQVDLQSNLKVCMPFNGSAADVSGNGNHGTVSGNVTLTTDRFGQPNKAYQFVNGTNDFISISNFNNVAPTNELTIAMWAKSDLVATHCLFLLNPDNSSDRCVGCANYTGVGLIWDYGDIYNSGRNTSNIFQDLGWHHYTFVFSQSNNFKRAYVDGILEISSSVLSWLNNKNFPFYIGAGSSDISGASLRWRGKIDEVVMYNRALDSAEVNALFSTAMCVPTAATDELSKPDHSFFFPAISQTGIFNYKGDINLLKKIEVTSLEGKIVMEIDPSKISKPESLDLSSFSDGVYFITTYSEEQRSTQKIILNRD